MQINFLTFIDVFFIFRLRLGCYILSFLSKLSNTYDFANLAMQELKDKYPNRKLLLKTSFVRV